MAGADRMRPGAVSTADDDFEVVFSGAAYRRGECAGLSTYDGRDSLAELIAERSKDPDDIETEFRPSRIKAIEKWREERRLAKAGADAGGPGVA
jgi:hypothetical protein